MTIPNGPTNDNERRLAAMISWAIREEVQAEVTRILALPDEEQPTRMMRERLTRLEHKQLPLEFRAHMLEQRALEMVKFMAENRTNTAYANGRVDRLEQQLAAVWTQLHSLMEESHHAQVREDGPALQGLREKPEEETQRIQPQEREARDDVRGLGWGRIDTEPGVQQSGPVPPAGQTDQSCL